MDWIIKAKQGDVKMSMQYQDLINLSDEKLIESYDEIAKHTSVGLNYYTEEIARRRTEKSDKLMIRLTIAITAMTFVMLIATIVNVVIATQ